MSNHPTLLLLTHLLGEYAYLEDKYKLENVVVDIAIYGRFVKVRADFSRGDETFLLYLVGDLSDTSIQYEFVREAEDFDYIPIYKGPSMYNLSEHFEILWGETV